MCADVAQLELIEPEQINFDKYEDGNKSFAPPPDGRYFARVPVFPMSDVDSEVWQSTKAGQFMVQVDPLELVDKSYSVRFTKLSATKYKNREGNAILDFIRGCGLDLRPQTIAEYKQALRQCSGRTVQFGLIWEAYNKADQTTLKGMENFPTGEDGKPQSWIPDPYEDGKKIYARGKVRYWVSGLQK